MWSFPWVTEQTAVSHPKEYHRRQKKHTDTPKRPETIKGILLSEKKNQPQKHFMTYLQN